MNGSRRRSRRVRARRYSAWTAALLLLGVMTTVGTAWWVAALRSRSAPEFVRGRTALIVVFEDPQSGGVFAVADEESGSGWRKRAIQPWPEAAESRKNPDRVTLHTWIVPEAGWHMPTAYASRTEWQFGFPMLAMWGAVGTDLGPNRGECWTSLVATSTPSIIPYPQEFPSALPSGILPLGFALNTLVYTSAWGSMVGLPFMTIRAVRMYRARQRSRRHACLACGYPRIGLAAAAACPECGEQARPSDKIAAASPQ